MRIVLEISRIQRGRIILFSKEMPKPLCAIIVAVAAAPARVVGLRTVGGCHVHGRHLMGGGVSCPQAAPLWAPPLYELATGVAPAAWPRVSTTPYGLAVGGRHY
ncbi:hypothetical protein GW17_00060373 [Ensete ventricosum]|nr:hypothetical protein GW17_00060373 [Ensete ventricosum]